MLPSRDATVSVTLLSCVFIGMFLDTGVNGEDEVDSFDPESLYKYFKDQAKSMDTAYIAEADGLAYFTPMSKRIMENGGQVSKEEILHYYNSLSNEDKREMYNAQTKIKSCWDDSKNDGLGFVFSRSYEYCYFHWLTDPSCPTEFEFKQLVGGDTRLNLVSCLSQKPNGKVFSAPEYQRKPFLSNQGLHIEAGMGAALLLYASGSTGVGFSLYHSQNLKVTTTTCYGIKFDVSLEMSFSVSYLFDMDDLPGQSTTIEMGVDIPGLEVGIDLLLHYSGSTLIGFGFSFGVGVGLIPFDYATSYCNTKIVAGYKDSALINVGWVPGWKCNPGFLGVVSEGKYICCPENNPSKECNTGFCWFIGTQCPHTPQELYPSKGLNFIISRTSCLGLMYIAEAHRNWRKCIAYWNRDRQQKYMYYRFGECWFSQTRSVDTCVWAPSTFHHLYFIRQRN